jgi:glyceraldehyde 3-phosphate dehydrogenase
MIKVGINGFGRIGRCFFKSVLENSPNISVVAINDISEVSTLAQLLRFDTTYGRLSSSVKAEGNYLIVGEKNIPVYSHRNPIDIPWGDHGVDIVIESTGKFTDALSANDHRVAGAKKVIISAPSKNSDLTIVLGVNEKLYAPEEHNLISIASCTTNCLAPMLDVIHQFFGVVSGHMVTAHAFTQDQNVQDGPHRDMRRARSAFHNIIQKHINPKYICHCP